MKTTLELKKIVIENDLVKKTRQFSKTHKRHYWLNQVNEIGNYITKDLGFSDEVATAAINMSRALYERKKRVFRRIEEMINCSGQNVYFLTLTFRNDVLNNTTAQTRRRYVQRFLKSISEYYVGNIDFGKNTSREHYHGIVCIDGEFPRDNFFPYGLSNSKLVGHADSDAQKISKYITKLGYHSVKQLNDNNLTRLIYSRNILPW